MISVKSHSSANISRSVATICISLLVGGCTGGGGERPQAVGTSEVSVKASALAEISALWLASEAATRAVTMLHELDSTDTVTHHDVLPHTAKDDSLGRALNMYMVRLDALSSYSLQSDPFTLLTKLERIIYPVYADGELTAPVSLELEGAAWEFVASGELSTPEIQVLSQLPAERVAFIVTIPGLSSISFLATVVGNELHLAVLADYPEYGLSRGATASAHQVFLQLAPFASVVDTEAPG